MTSVTFLLLTLSLGQLLHAQLSLNGMNTNDRISLADLFHREIERYSAVEILRTADLSPHFVLLVPSLLRTDSKENILLQAYSQSQPITVKISVFDYPAKSKELLTDSVVLSSENNFSSLKSIQLSSQHLRRDEQKKKFVYITAEFGSIHREEQVVLVSFHSGYIFIQTDKPVYNPGDKVLCRAFLSTPAFHAFDTTISIEVKNPDGIAVQGASRVRASEGIYSEVYDLSDIANEGTWKVVAKFDHWKQNTFSTDFEVKKYVLPAFNVTLTPKKSHYSLEDKELQVEISARYLYDEPVHGTAFVVFGVEMDGQKIRLPTMKQVNNLDKGTVTLTLEELKQAYPDTESLIGRSLYVKASVLTTSGSDLVEAEKSGIKIVTSPYVISFRGVPKYFKPALPLDLTILVSHHDGSPANNVPVHVSLLPKPFILHKGVIRASLNMPAQNSQQTITVETRVDGLKVEQQARANLVVEPYEPKSRTYPNYLYISSADDLVSVGQNLNFQAHITATSQMKNMVQTLTYLVLNKGKIIKADQLKIGGQSVTNIPLTVTKDMMPSFRVVAYYIIPLSEEAEVVADSVWVDVTDTCVGSLELGHEGKRVSDEYRPGNHFKFKIRGDPGAKVSLVAVDNSIFLLSKSRLTQQKIWGIVDRGDMGCTHGGGKISFGVFADAGLLFFSNRAGSSDIRTDLQCQQRARRRRSAAKLRQRAQLASEYSDELLQRCCQDGMREIPMAYSCYRRSFYITEGWECIKAFFQCCVQYRGEDMGPSRMPPTTGPPTTEPPTTTAMYTTPSMPFFHFHHPVMYGRVTESVETAMPSFYGLSGLPPPVSEEIVLSANVDELLEEDDSIDYTDPYDIYVRSKFYESWLWTDVKLPSMPDDNDGLATFPVETILPDSITQWGVLAVSASPVTGFCVAEPFNVRTFKPFFVDLRLPHSVARHEHVEIKAVLQNHKDQDLDVIVILEKTVDICSVALNEAHRQKVKLGRQSSMVLPYTIIPLRAGELTLEVKVMAKDFAGHDGVKKTLRVVVEGVQKTDVRTYVLDPVGKGDSEGEQLVKVGKAQLGSLIPNSEPQTFVNVRGSLLADTIDNSITDDSLASLIRMPGGCVEQNLARMTLPLIATHHLDRTNEWESVGVQRRLEAIKYIQNGYVKQLSYRKQDNSYPPYSKEGTSTWVTAFVVKVFSMAHPFITVKEDHLCGPLTYLLKEKQHPLGFFQEDNAVYTTSMTGGLQGAEAKTTLTAFVLIALAEAQAVVSCQSDSVSIEEGFTEASVYLRERYNRLRRPYSVAIACYALAISNQGCSKRQLLKFAAPGGTHWPDSDNWFFTLEATGYALLALVRGGHMEEAAKPFQWLNEQRRQGGGYGSTQSTLVVLQSLSEYLIKKPPPPDMSLYVSLGVPGRSDVRWVFNPKSAFIARSNRVPLDREFQIVAYGKGQGILEVITVYNELPDVHENRSCKSFDLKVAIAETTEKPPEDVEKSFRISVNIRSLDERPARMVVLDISLPTGFEPENQDLELLSNSVDRYISNFHVVDNLSDRASLIVHLLTVSNKDPEIITFRLHQKFKVGLLQPATVTAYQYYNPDKRCSRFYSPPEDKQQLSQICMNNICRCTQGDCCVLKTATQPITDSERLDAVCQGIHHVFKVRVLGVSQSQYDRYNMEIVLVIKEATEVGLNERDRRVFVSHATCRDGLRLQQGKEYLVIGSPADIWQAASATGGHTYILGKNTWVEDWPSETMCFSNRALKPRCVQLQNFASHFLERGCQS